MGDRMTTGSMTFIGVCDGLLFKVFETIWGFDKELSKSIIDAYNSVEDIKNGDIHFGELKVSNKTGKGLSFELLCRDYEAENEFKESYDFYLSYDDIEILYKFAKLSKEMDSLTP